MKTFFTHSAAFAAGFIVAVGGLIYLAYGIPDAPAAQPTAYHHAARWA